MASLSSIFLNIVPKIDNNSMNTAFKKMSDGFKKAGETVAKIGGASQKALTAGASGLQILDAINNALDKTKGKIEELVAIGGGITDLAGGLETSEERLLSVYQAFNKAGVGSQQLINDLLIKFQESVATGLIDIGDSDLLTGFMNTLNALNQMPSAQRNTAIATAFGGDKLVGLNKVLGVTGQATANLNNLTADDIALLLQQAGGARGAATVGDQIEGNMFQAMLTQLGSYNSKGALTDLSEAANIEIATANAAADTYTAGSLQANTQVQQALSVVTDSLPTLLTNILTILSEGQGFFKTIDSTLNTFSETATQGLSALKAIKSGGGTL